MVGTKEQLNSRTIYTTSLPKKRGCEHAQVKSPKLIFLKQQQQKELGRPRQPALFETDSFFCFYSDCYRCVCALSFSIPHHWLADIHTQPGKSSDSTACKYCFCVFGEWVRESHNLCVQVKRVQTRSLERFQKVFCLCLGLFIGVKSGFQTIVEKPLPKQLFRPITKEQTSR